MRCRHEQNSWILGGTWRWCYRCGAIQHLKATGRNTLIAVSRWVRPTGPNGKNPHDEMLKLPIRRKPQEDREP